MKTRMLRDIEVSEVGMGCMALSHGYGKIPAEQYSIEAIRNAINPDLPIGFGEVDYYPGQVMYLCADTSSLAEDTGFAPEYTFEQGIKETVEWFREEFGA